MGKVEPIRNIQEIYDIEDKLFAMHTKRADRMFVMFEVGIYLGLRIGDMLQLRVGDIRGKQSYVFVPQKTDTHKGAANYRAKKLEVTIPPELRKVVGEMYAGKPDDALLFPSQKTDGGAEKPITRQEAWREMRMIQQMCRIKYPVGCHTLRKTFGYHIYQDRHDVAWLQGWFQHSSPAVTLIYIGIADDEKKAVTDHMPYGNRSRFDWASKRA